MTASAPQPQSPAAPARVLVALAGRQNAGKTSLLMHLTGSAQRPVNFAGSSVERCESSVRVGATELRAVDLPGIASLSAVSRDEEVALGYLRGEAGEVPDVLCAVVDAAKLSVELHLLDALVTLGRPIVVALNKNDVAEREGRPVDAARLSELLGMPVVETNALACRGIDALRQALVAAAGAPPAPALTDTPDALAQAALRPVPPSPRGLTDRLDAVLLHRVWGLPILALLVLGIFQAIFTGADPFMGLIEDGQGWLTGLVEDALEPGALRSFLVDGLIGGVGSIVIFLPQIVLLMTLVSLLEASGYMARAAFLLDRVLSRVGLNGRSFVPLVSSFACAVPGILSTRIIDNERDRIATIVVAPLMSCSARLPVYVVLIGAFFPVAWAGVVLFGIYLLGILTAALVAWALKLTVLRGGHSLLMMELPVYQRPSLKVVRAQVWGAARDFMVLAGTIIFGTAIVIWLLSYYPRPAEIHDRYEAQRTTLVAPQADDEAATAAHDQALAELDAAERAAYLEQSWLARGGKAIQPVFAPAGFDWRITVGILAAFPARELIVPTMGILYSLGDVDPGDYDVDSLEASAAGEGDGLRDKLRGAVHPDGTRVFSPLVALALMVFFALCSQCAATLGAIRRETRSWKWPTFTFVYMTAFAWLMAVLVYQVGSAAGLG